MSLRKVFEPYYKELKEAMPDTPPLVVALAHLKTRFECVPAFLHDCLEGTLPEGVPDGLTDDQRARLKEALRALAIAFTRGVERPAVQ